MALSGDAMLLSGDAMALLGDAMALSDDAMALLGDAMALLGDTMLLSGDAMLLPNLIHNVFKRRGTQSKRIGASPSRRVGTQSFFEQNLLQQIYVMLYLGSLRCRTNNLFLAGKNAYLPSWYVLLYVQW
ncbi:hypothetical protein [uncultured Nostoc sp.]|uniref:hypothetical protein n=1 Tax=uncultured Nostoc sp. TaxID=340711 RepID=UPI0035CB791A